MLKRQSRGRFPLSDNSSRNVDWGVERRRGDALTVGGPAPLASPWTDCRPSRKEQPPSGWWQPRSSPWPGFTSISRAAPDAYGDQLRLVIVLTRHGVRSPLLSAEGLACFAAQPWPKWETAPAVQTPHGNQLIALMGDYYRQRFLRSGLLSGDPAVDGPQVFVRADNDQRTMETARILPVSRSVPGGRTRRACAGPGKLRSPLFQPFRAHVGHPGRGAGRSLPCWAEWAAIPATSRRAYATQFAELQGHPPWPRGDTSRVIRVRYRRQHRFARAEGLSG